MKICDLFLPFKETFKHTELMHSIIHTRRNNENWQKIKVEHAKLNSLH